MTQPATHLPLTPRERLRWRRVMDALLIDAIYGSVIRDTSLPSEETCVAASALNARPEPEPSIMIG